MSQRAPLIAAAFDEVSRWRADSGSTSDQAVRALLAAYPPDRVADLLWADLPESVSTTDVADLLSLWTWRTDDNGASIMRTMERWIDECADSRKVAVALNLDAYPFVDHRLRLARLKLLAARFPEHRSRCESMIDATKLMMQRDCERG